MTARQDGAPRRRFRFQFSLRLLFAVITLCALLLGLWVWQYRRLQQAVAAVHRLGGFAVAGDESFVGGLLRPIIFPKIVKVSLHGTEATDDDLKLVARLSRLESLDLSKTKISAGGLAPLGGLRRLTSLSLADTAIGDDDLAHVGRLTGLVSLDLSGTAVSDAGLEHLGSLSALQALSIQGSKVTGAGLEQLCGLPVLYSLSVDESQITPAAVGSLQRMPGVKRLFVHVPRGTGKRAWELVRPLQNVAASGVRRADARAVWVASAAWENTIAGVIERIRARVALSPQQRELLLDALVETCKEEVWRSFPPYSPGYPSEPPVVQDPIRTVDELIELVKKGGPWSLRRARSFVESGAARPAVPALLKLLDEPKRKPDYGMHVRAVRLLVRIAGEDREVVAALARVFESDDEQLRIYAAYAFDDHQGARGNFWPKFNAQQADALLPLLLRLSKDPSSDVRSAIADALGSIVPAHPKHADAALAVLLEMLGAEDNQESVAVFWAWRSIVEACPEQAKRVLPKLLAMLEAENPQAWGSSPVLRALDCFTPKHPEAARALVPVWLRMLRERKQPPESVGGALGRIVQDNPGELKNIIPVIVAMLEDEDRGVRAGGAVMLERVAQGVWEQKGDSPKAAVPKSKP